MAVPTYITKNNLHKRMYMYNTRMYIIIIIIKQPRQNQINPFLFINWVERDSYDEDDNSIWDNLDIE